MRNNASPDNSGISVIIVNWNAGDLLERCVQSVYTQTLLPLDVIVVNNGSTDGSIKNIISKFPLVKVVEAAENLGFAAANNLAVKLVSKESVWIAFLNPDAFAEPEWLDCLLKAAQHNPEFSFFGCRLMAANTPDVLDGVGDAYHASGLVWREGHGQPMDSSVFSAKEIFSPCAAAAMFRKDAFLEAGGFDEDYFCYVEDVDLGFRLRLLGYRCLYVPDSIVHHVGSAVTGKRSDFSVYHGHRNLVWTYVKNMPGILFWVFLPLHFLMNLVTLAVFTWRGQGQTLLLAKRDALKGLPKMWRKRQLIQSSRVATVCGIWQLMNKRMFP